MRSKLSRSILTATVAIASLVATLAIPSAYAQRQGRGAGSETATSESGASIEPAAPRRVRPERNRIERARAERARSERADAENDGSERRRRDPDRRAPSEDRAAPAEAGRPEPARSGTAPAAESQPRPARPGKAAERPDAPPASRPASAPVRSSGSPSARISIEYRGSLQDDAGQPVSGVFPLRFHLYDHQLGAAALWSEQHFVAVVDGRYTVPLGSRHSLLSSHVEGTRWMGVELVGEGEILRDRLVVEIVSAAGTHSYENARAGARATDGAASRDGGRSTFADVAEHATFADRARVAERAEALGEMSVDEIERLSNLALERLGEHIADPNAHQATGRGRVGSERRPMDAIGGRGGSAYNVQCPPGFVVTGIEGTAGRVVDGLRIVCSPLQ